MSEYLISDETLATIRRTCYEAGKAGKEVFSVRSPSVEIVRCGDCDFSTDGGEYCRLFAAYEPIGGGDEYGESLAIVSPDGFCAWGKRRESEDQ